MVEAAGAGHRILKRVLARMAERRMTEVVSEANASVRSSFSPSARATVRPIWATSMLWVRRTR